MDLPLRLVALFTLAAGAGIVVGITHRAIATQHLTGGDVWAVGVGVACIITGWRAARR